MPKAHEFSDTLINQAVPIDGTPKKMLSWTHAPQGWSCYPVLLCFPVVTQSAAGSSLASFCL